MHPAPSITPNRLVFLVDLRGGRTVVEQLSVTQEFLQAGSDERRLRTDDRIARFFERTALPR